MVRVKDSLPAPVRVMFRQSTQGSAQLTANYSTIAVETLKVENMSRSAKGTAVAPGKNVSAKAGLNRSIRDASWGRLKMLLQYKAIRNGGQVIEVPPHGTSQICSGCGVIVPKALNVRWHDCPDCGLSIDRDHNAALNVLHRAVAGPSIANSPVVAN